MKYTRSKLIEIVVNDWAEKHMWSNVDYDLISGLNRLLNDTFRFTIFVITKSLHEYDVMFEIENNEMATMNFYINYDN